jgi:alpha-N-arabinofuranosidase
MNVDVDLRSLTDLSAATHTCLADDDPDAVNTSEQPDRVTPRRLDDPKLDGGRLQAVLPPLSWNMIRIS